MFQCRGENTDKQQFLKTLGVVEEHINKTFTYPQDVAPVCRSFKFAKLEQPANLTKLEFTDGMGKKMMWEMDMKTFMKRRDLLKGTQGPYTPLFGDSAAP